jgi:hypothetical protein
MSDNGDRGDKFTEEERITANLRLRSVSPTSRTLLGLFAFVPPPWRGPLALVVVLVLALLAYKLPAFVSWLRGAP